MLLPPLASGAAELAHGAQFSLRQTPCLPLRLGDAWLSSGETFMAGSQIQNRRDLSGVKSPAIKPAKRQQPPASALPSSCAIDNAPDS